MPDNTYDQLAQVLREMRDRFGDDAFANRRRLTGLLADRLPDAKLEIRVVLDAVDDGVVGELLSATRDQLGMQIDRLSARMESRRGIRTDIARASIGACAYALGLGPLPSQYRSTSSGPTIPTGPVQSTDWVGVTEFVGGTVDSAGARSAPVPTPALLQAGPGIFTKPAYRVGAGIVAAVALGAIGMRFFGAQKAPTPPPVSERARDSEPPPLDNRPTEVRRDRPPDTNPPRSDPQRTVRSTQSPTTGQQPSAPPGGFADELRDFGVPASKTLQKNVGSATPSTIPGARIAATAELVAEIAKGTPMVLIDVLSDTHAQTLPGARGLAGAGNPGSFDDAIQRQFSSALKQVTGGRKDTPVVIFCSGPSCWYSYNASLRAVAAGYSNVYWYRGGIAAWRAAGQALAPLSQ
jgi:PQQ-dependent catabolism-associated CXXCW motif protein